MFIFLLQLEFTVNQVILVILLSSIFIFSGFFMVRDAAITKNAYDIKKELEDINY